MTLGDLLGNATTETPLVVLMASGILAVAGFIGRRVARSIARQGARVGTLERTLRSERLRRRQLEQCIREDGVPLPYWPDDPAELYAANRRPSYPAPRDDGPDWTPADQLVTTFDPLPRVPVPPLSDEERTAAARHRRS